jgi:excisionase family DNA binding protein
MRRILTELNEDQLKELVKEVIDQSMMSRIFELQGQAESDFLTVVEACEFLKIGRTTLYKHINAGHIDAYKVGQKTLIDKKELETFIRTNSSNK